LVLVALVGSDHQRGTVKKVSIHLKSLVITPSEGGRCNIVCCGIFRYSFPFVGLLDTWMVLLHIGNDNESFLFCSLNFELLSWLNKNGARKVCLVNVSYQLWDCILCILLARTLEYDIRV
jgi:hypothetical protein